MMYSVPVGLNLCCLSDFENFQIDFESFLTDSVNFQTGFEMRLGFARRTLYLTVGFLMLCQIAADWRNSVGYLMILADCLSFAGCWTPLGYCLMNLGSLLQL